MKFYEVFAKLCKEKGESPNAVCEKVGLSNSTYTFWKKKGTTPRETTLIKIADYFNVSVDYLLGVENRNAMLEEKALLMVSDMSEQENALISMFRSTSEEGRLRIIHAVVEIHNEEEKKIATEDTEGVG